MATCQLEHHGFHMRRRGIETAHLEPFFIGCLAGVRSARVDKDHTTGRSKMFFTPVSKALVSALDYADYIVIMAVTRIGVTNIRSL